MQTQNVGTTKKQHAFPFLSAAQTSFVCKHSCLQFQNQALTPDIFLRRKSTEGEGAEAPIQLM